jgi:Zn-dependent alcohol dehydrogenase
VLGHEVAGEVVAHGPGSPAAQLDALPVGTKAVGAFIMPCMDCFFCNGGQEEMCEKFFAFNRLKGTLYDGTTRLYSADRGDPIAMYRSVTEELEMKSHGLFSRTIFRILRETAPLPHFTHPPLYTPSLYTAWVGWRSTA